MKYFYPRPLRRGRPGMPVNRAISSTISIHALFAEGDLARDSWLSATTNFYPRPLRRGRRDPAGQAARQ